MRATDTPGWAHRRAADGLDVPHSDLGRLHDEFHRRLDESVRRGPRRGPSPGGSVRWLGVLGLVSAVVAVALAVVSLLAARDASARAGSGAASSSSGVRPGPATVADLRGLWLLDADDAWPPLWLFGANGSFELLRAEDLVGGPARRQVAVPHGSAQLVVADRSGCRAQFRVERLSVDRLRLGWLTADPDCSGDLGPDRDWELSTATRVAPSVGEVTSRYVRGVPVLARWESDVEGIWLLSGSSRVLAVSQGRYAVLDDLTGLTDGGDRVRSEQGRLRLLPGGLVQLQPDGIACPRVYVVRADYAVLDARLAADSCGRLGGAADTWVRLL